MDSASSLPVLHKAEKPVKIAPRYNSQVDNFRDAEYPMIKGKTYLDHGGTTLYAKSLIERYTTDLMSNLYGNPHSDSTPSALSSIRVEDVRRHALQFFNADPQHFDLVFVPNATAGVKMVMESFRDLASASTSSEHGPGQFWYGYHRDAHTSIVGVRETAGVHHCFYDDQEVEEWIDELENERRGHQKLATGRLGLFAYPGQSNMTGRRLPLSWPGRLRRSAKGNYTYSLFDAAALATTAPIDLSDVDEAPDFTVLSFYKIFGFPNLGALIVRKNSGHILQWRKYFGGGTVDMVVCMKEAWHARKDYTTNAHYSLHDQLEDGTLPFHSIFALGAALDVHAMLYASMSNISAHTAFLGRRLYDGLSILKYANGRPVCRIYKEASATYGDSATQGATLAFNVQRADGSLVPYTEVERLADERQIYVRSGGLCNPGGIATYLGLEPWEMKRAFSAGHRCGHATEIVSGKPTGVVRVSLGAMSTISDVDVFLGFMSECFTAAARVPDLEQISMLAAGSNFGTEDIVQRNPLLKSASYGGTVPTLYGEAASKQTKITTTLWVPSPPSSIWTDIGEQAPFERERPTSVEQKKLRSSKSLVNLLKMKRKTARSTIVAV